MERCHIITHNTAEELCSKCLALSINPGDHTQLTAIEAYNPLSSPIRAMKKLADIFFSFSTSELLILGELNLNQEIISVIIISSLTQLTNQSDTSQYYLHSEEVLEILILKSSQMSHLNVFQTLDPDVAQTLFSNTSSSSSSIADAHTPFRIIHFNNRF